SQPAFRGIDVPARRTGEGRAATAQELVLAPISQERRARPGEAADFERDGRRVVVEGTYRMLDNLPMVGQGLGNPGGEPMFAVPRDAQGEPAVFAAPGREATRYIQYTRQALQE